MKEFLAYVVGQLVDRPDELALSVDSRRDKEHHFTVLLRRSEIGKVIGKQGHTIRALRNLLSAAAARHGERAALEIVERPEA